jgi:hypothetical protein
MHETAICLKYNYFYRRKLSYYLYMISRANQTIRRYRTFIKTFRISEPKLSELSEFYAHNFEYQLEHHVRYFNL